LVYLHVNLEHISNLYDLNSVPHYIIIPQILDSGLNSKLDPGLDVPHSQLGLN